MAILYSEYNHDKLYAPQYTRVRHRYRGPRESYKQNLEQSQIRFVIYKLYDFFNTFRQEFLTKYTQLHEGHTIATVTPGDVPGLDELTQQLQQLQGRVKALEQYRT